MKTFTYKNYENCYFRVGSYAADNKAWPFLLKI